MDVVNLDTDEWDRTEEPEGWRSKDAWIGARLNAEMIGASMYELEPGNTLWPYHTHHAIEEWLLVVRGQPTLRSAEGGKIGARSVAGERVVLGRPGPKPDYRDGED
jgi:uncharacterized cupin superfamily protein